MANGPAWTNTGLPCNIAEMSGELALETVRVGDHNTSLPNFPNPFISVIVFVFLQELSALQELAATGSWIISV